jgi:hypothetical protein
MFEDVGLETCRECRHSFFRSKLVKLSGADRVLSNTGGPFGVGLAFRPIMVGQRVIGEPPNLVQNIKAKRAEIGRITADNARLVATSLSSSGTMS